MNQLRTVLLSVFLFLQFTASAQKERPKLFINCQQARCYSTYLRTELDYFTFSRDQMLADIQILITDQGNAGGGRNYQMNFIGQGDYKGDDYLLEFETKQSDTEALARRILLTKMSQGLMHYVGATDIVQDVKVTFPRKPAEGEASEETEEKDPWNNWIFGLGGSGRFSGESNRSEVRFNTNVRGGRTTEKSKYSFYTYLNQNTNSVTLDGDTEVAKVNSYGFTTLYVTSFAKNWSVGGLMKGFHSVYSNIQFSNSLAPAIEYSIFPIQDFNKKQFRWIYQAGYRRLDYIETTIYDRLKEAKPYHQITSILGYTQPWGNFSAELNGYQYIDDPEKYRLSLELELNWRVFQGVSLRFYGSGSQIKNQISLAKTESSSEEILLGGQQLPTSFAYFTSFGLNYTFGSVNNSIVNPRFSGVN
ncbi:hypothetical protein [Jiulongibacter sp. NS-SX5]|uniref:hypothetical protein n=1 Tax=Jiulongibacter sp. NS-SX5 TaxID=3463854 RepID=UPI004057E6A0